MIERLQGRALHDVLGSSNTETLLIMEQRVTNVMKVAMERLQETASFGHNAEISATLEKLQDLTKQNLEKSDVVLNLTRTTIKLAQRVQKHKDSVRNLVNSYRAKPA